MVRGDSDAGKGIRGVRVDLGDKWLEVWIFSFGLKAKSRRLFMLQTLNVKDEVER